MLNVTKELTALARKLGYTGTAPDTVAKAINAITSVAGEGSGSGSGNVLIVNFEFTEDIGYTYNIKADKTYEEVQAAYDNGTPIFGTYLDSNIYYLLIFSNINKNAHPYNAQFHSIRNTRNEMEWLEINMPEDRFNIGVDYKTIVTE